MTIYRKFYGAVFSGALLISTSASAVPIAVIDSGTDLGHPDLIQKQWTNLGDLEDAVDNDDNGFIDDTHGWNFAENNNKLFDKRLVGAFSPDVKYFFEVQVRMLTGKATEADKEWIKIKRGDAKFIGELGVFGNFAHGTHVAGIAARMSDQASILPLKIIPTRASKYFEEAANGQMSLSAGGAGIRKRVIFFALERLARAQGANMDPVAIYLRTMKPRIANCSFGTSVTQLKMVLAPLLKLVLRRAPTDAELNEYGVFFMSKASETMESLATRNRSTLFVFAAGNDGTDNDRLPTMPANIKKDNTITVAATVSNYALASFSNFGAETVDIAAPGVGILSSVPGNEAVLMSGTSQAAPYIAGLAGAVLDRNPALKPKEVKALLMQTVDVKAFLAGKVKSAGVANSERALAAADLSRVVSLDQAVQMAKTSVSDSPEHRDVQPEAAFVSPMMGLIQ